MDTRRSVLPPVLGVMIGAALVGFALPSLIDADPPGTVATGRAATSMPLDAPAGSPGGVDDPATPGATPSARGAPDDSPVNDGAGSSTGPTASNGATGRGVTATDVKVGVLLLDLGSVGALGLGVPGLTPREQQEDWQVFVDRVNDEGGAGGREVVPVYRRFDSLSPDDMRAACLYLAEDAAVFAAFTLAGFQGDAPLCLTREHGMPYITTWGEPESFYAYGLEFTWAMSRERMLRNQVGSLHRQGALDGVTIGIVDSDHPAIEPVVDNAMLPELARYGYRVAHRSTLSQNFEAAAAQIPLEVSQMRAKGVDYVLVALQLVLINQWVNEGDAQGFRPAYALSDFQSGVTDFTLQALPRSFDGTGITSTRIGEWRRDFPLPAVDRSCLDYYAAKTGRRPAPDNNRFATLQAACGILQQFRAGVKAAGPGLTEQGFSRAMQGRGTMELPLYAGGSWRPGKFDASDYVRTARADMACRCWLPVDDFVPAG